VLCCLGVVFAGFFFFWFLECRGDFPLSMRGEGPLASVRFFRFALGLARQLVDVLFRAFQLKRRLDAGFRRCASPCRESRSGRVDAAFTSGGFGGKKSGPFSSEAPVAGLMILANGDVNWSIARDAKGQGCRKQGAHMRRDLYARASDISGGVRTTALRNLSKVDVTRRDGKRATRCNAGHLRACFHREARRSTSRSR